MSSLTYTRYLLEWNKVYTSMCILSALHFQANLGMFRHNLHSLKSLRVLSLGFIR